METQIKPGSILLISKWHYGPLFPSGVADIPWLNTIFSARHGSNIPSRIRLGGTSSINVGDIIVFRWEENERFIVKRCIAGPGQILEINGENIYVNKMRVAHRQTVGYMYRLWIKDGASTTFMADLKDLSVTNNKGEVTYNARLSHTDKVSLLRKGVIDSVSLRPSLKAKYFFQTDTITAIRIPKKGMSIRINEKNIARYFGIIRKFEEPTAKIINDTLYIGNKKILSYRFTKNYYFAMGDNRSMSFDSRQSGFLPQPNIIGKVVAIYSTK